MRKLFPVFSLLLLFSITSLICCNVSSWAEDIQADYGVFKKLFLQREGKKIELDPVTTPDLFDNSVGTCENRKAVEGAVAFCTGQGSQAVVTTSLTPGSVPGTTPPTVTTTTTAGTTTTSSTLINVTLRYVRPAGSDTLCDGTTNIDAGSGACAWATISKAGGAGVITPGSAGATVYVAPGTYTGTIKTYTVGSATQPVKFISSVPWGAIIAPAGTSSNAVWEVRGPYQQINGFQFTAPGYSGAVACYASLVSTGHHCQLLNNYVAGIAIGDGDSCPSFGALNTGVQGGGGRPSDSLYGYNVVKGNVVRIVGSRPNCNQTHGIYAGGPYDVIQNNLVSGVVGWGINYWGDIRYGVIGNNTVFNNNQGGILIGTDGYGTYTDVQYVNVLNNAVVNNGLASIADEIGGISLYDNGSSNNLFNGNLLYGNVSKYAGDDQFFKGMDGGYNHVPCAWPCDDANAKSGTDATTFINFVPDWNANPATNYLPGNYALRSGSNAIDNGTTACVNGGYTPCVPSDDFIGTARPKDVTWDIGGWEYDSGASTTTTTATSSTTSTTLTYAPDWRSYVTSALTMETSVTTDSGGGSCAWASSDLTQTSSQVVVGSYSGNDTTNIGNQSSTCTALAYTGAFTCGGWWRRTGSAGTVYLISKKGTNNGYGAQYFSTDVFWYVGNGSSNCEMQTTTDFFPATSAWVFWAGISTGSALQVYGNGALQTGTCGGGGCTGSGTSCTYSGVASSSNNFLLGGDDSANGFAGFMDDLFCDTYSASNADDGVVDPAALCRILACGLDGQGCQCNGTVYASGTGDGTRYKLYGNGCSLPNCNQETP